MTNLSKLLLLACVVVMAGSCASKKYLLLENGSTVRLLKVSSGANGLTVNYVSQAGHKEGEENELYRARRKEEMKQVWRSYIGNRDDQSISVEKVFIVPHFGHSGFYKYVGSLTLVRNGQGRLVEDKRRDIPASGEGE